MVAAAVLVDGNGELPGLDELQSNLAVACIVVAGLSVDTAVGALDPKRRPLAVGLVLVYVVPLLPLFAW